MSGYKLADGSLSSIYKIGDEFEVVEHTGAHRIGDTIIADEIVGNNFYSGIYLISWSWVKPTPETKRKAHYRETGKWLVLEGDYVAHTDMTFKQFKEWCDAAKACGFSLDHVNTNVCVITFADDEGDLVSSWYTDIGAKTNTTEEFLGFLAKEEKGVSKFKVGDKVKIRKDSKYYLDYDILNPKGAHGEVKSVRSGELGITVEWDNGNRNGYSESDLEFWFTKADLKDGMRCIDREGDVWYVCGQNMSLSVGGSAPLDDWDDGLNWRHGNHFDITKVVDRDGTILFASFDAHPNFRIALERSLTELTLEEIAEKFGLPVERVRIKK